MTMALVIGMVGGYFSVANRVEAEGYRRGLHLTSSPTAHSESVCVESLTVTPVIGGTATCSPGATEEHGFMVPTEAHDGQMVATVRDTRVIVWCHCPGRH